MVVPPRRRPRIPEVELPPGPEPFGSARAPLSQPVNRSAPPLVSGSRAGQSLLPRRPIDHAVGVGDRPCPRSPMLAPTGCPAWTGVGTGTSRSHAPRGRATRRAERYSETPSECRPKPSPSRGFSVSSGRRPESRPPSETFEALSQPLLSGCHVRRSGLPPGRSLRAETRSEQCSPPAEAGVETAAVERGSMPAVPIAHGRIRDLRAIRPVPKHHSEPATIRFLQVACLVSEAPLRVSSMRRAARYDRLGPGSNW